MLRNKLKNITCSIQNLENASKQNTLIIILISHVKIATVNISESSSGIISIHIFIKMMHHPTYLYLFLHLIKISLHSINYSSTPI